MGRDGGVQERALLGHQGGNRLTAWPWSAWPGFSESTAYLSPWKHHHPEIVPALFQLQKTGLTRFSLEEMVALLWWLLPDTLGERGMMTTEEAAPSFAVRQIPPSVSAA